MSIPNKKNKKQHRLQCGWKARQPPAERPPKAGDPMTVKQYYEEIAKKQDLSYAEYPSLGKNTYAETYAEYEKFISQNRPLEERFFEETSWTFDPTKFGFVICQQAFWSPKHIKNSDYEYSGGWYALKNIHTPGDTARQIGIIQLSHCDYEVTIAEAVAKWGSYLTPGARRRKINYNIPNEEVAKVIFEAQKFLEVPISPEPDLPDSGITYQINSDEWKDMLRESFDLPNRSYGCRSRPLKPQLRCPYCGVRHSGALRSTDAAPNSPQKYCSACERYFD